MSKNRPSLKEKQAGTEASINEISYDFNDFFAVDTALKAELQAKGLVWRWINAIKLKANYGYDSRQWAPYQRKSQAPGMTSFSDAEGFVRRGDLILAVQPKAVDSARKKQLAARNAAQNTDKHSKQAAEELRRHMRDSKIQADVTEGYEDSGSSDD